MNLSQFKTLCEGKKKSHLPFSETHALLALAMGHDLVLHLTKTVPSSWAPVLSPKKDIAATVVSSLSCIIHFFLLIHFHLYVNML